MTRVDLLFSLLLTALGGAVAVESWRMPRLEAQGVAVYAAPGLVPGLIGLVLAALGVILLARSLGRLRARAPETAPAPTAAAATSGASAAVPLSGARFALTTLLTVGYAAGLVGRLPFWLATFLFVTAFVWLFERPARPWRGLALAALQGALVAAAVTAVFRYLFLVQLP